MHFNGVWDLLWVFILAHTVTHASPRPPFLIFLGIFFIGIIITTPNWNCFGGETQACHLYKYNKHFISWLPTAKKTFYFLGIPTKAPRKTLIFLMVHQNSQGNMNFSWRFILHAKEYVFLGCLESSPRKSKFTWRYILAAKKIASRQSNSNLV